MKTIVFIVNNGRQTFTGKSAILILAILLLTSTTYSQEKPKQKMPQRDFTSRVWLSAHVLPGYGQFVNKQYWKLPIFYGGMAGGLYLGINANKEYLHRLYRYNSLAVDDPSKELFKQRMVQQKQTRNLYYATAGAFYMASVVDAVFVYSKGKHSPAAATIFSTLVPGLGQAYNRKYWKVPVVYGSLATLYFVTSWNNRGYTRFKTALRLNTDGDPETVDEFDGERKAEDLRYYMNSYRRNRDIAALGFAFVYILNVLDANVDAHLYDWNVDDNLSFRVEPTLINSDLALINSSAPVFGVSCRFTF